jgi:hypothetical protein
MPPQLQSSGDMPTFTVTSATSPETLALIRALVSSGAIAPAASEAAAGTLPSQAHPDVQLLLDAIPAANDGDVITSEYHNSLADALRVIARMLGDPSLARSVTANRAPVFLPDADNRPWTHHQGFVDTALTAADAEGTAEVEAHGWMQVDLPNGSRIERMTASGLRRGDVGLANLRLVRVSSEDPDQDSTPLSLLRLKPLDGDFTEEPGEFANRNATPAAEEELRRVDTSRFKYLVTAEALAVPTDSVVQLNAIRVECSRR